MSAFRRAIACTVVVATIAVRSRLFGGEARAAVCSFVAASFSRRAFAASFAIPARPRAKFPRPAACSRVAAATARASCHCAD